MKTRKIRNRKLTTKISIFIITLDLLNNHYQDLNKLFAQTQSGQQVAVFSWTLRTGRRAGHVCHISKPISIHLSRPSENARELGESELLKLLAT